MKILGFVKIFNELETGNLKRCLDNLTKICGKGNIVVCDDSSTDGSSDIIKKYTSHYIVLPDEFKKELEHKQKLLDLSLTLDPEWILWCDGDEIFEQRAIEAMPKLCKFGEQFGFDCFQFHEINLWASKCWFRVDNKFNDLWKINLWKNNGNLKFDVSEGLHKSQHPLGLTKSHITNLQLIHFGFSDLTQIARKYMTYKKTGQKGWALDRLSPCADGIQLQPANLQWFSEEDKPKIEPAPKKILEEEFEKVCKKYQ